MRSSQQTSMRDRHFRILERIALAVERMAPPIKVPNYQFPLEAFQTFDWESIDAFVEEIDRLGPCVVNWQGIRFQRQSLGNRFRDSTWFAVVVGSDERGDPIYQRLITFRPMQSRFTSNKHAAIAGSINEF